MSIKKYSKEWQALNDRQKEDLLGDVKQVMQITYGAWLKAGEVMQGKIEVDSEVADPNYLLHFNKKGIKILDQSFRSYGYSKTICDDSGLNTAIENYDTEGKFKGKTVCTFEGRIAKECQSLDGEGKLTGGHLYNYNNEGKITEQIYYRGEDKKLDHKIVWTYNEAGNPLTQIKYDENGAIQCRSETQYNEKGLKVHYSSVYTDPKMDKYSQRHEYKYNEQGDCIETNVYNIDGSLRKSYHNTYEYDGNGKRIVRHVEEEKPKGETEDFVNDEHGNWIRKTTWHNKVPVNIFVRTFVYFGENDNAILVHPLLNPQIMKEQTIDATNHLDELDSKDAKWLVEEPGRGPDNFNYQRYYAMRFKDIPSVISYSSGSIEAIILLEHLKKYMGATEVHTHVSSPASGWDRITRYTLLFPGVEGYLLQSLSIGSKSKELFDVPDAFDNASDGYVHIGQFQLLRPAEATGKRNEGFEQELEHHIQKCTLNGKPDTPSIQMIQVKGNSYVLEEYPVDDDFNIRDLNVNYGYGFETFHKDLMQRFSSGSKGLVLFHGIPGTGKTYYIRHLLRKMAVSKKAVIYMPPNMVDHLVDPIFMTFLVDQIRTFSANGQFCVLLIEDAEPLLAKREKGVRIQGVTNLLNMSDGILNDLLNLQIICTFNTDLQKLDSALLRPGRLIARKEFKALSTLDANLLASRLGIKHVFDEPATLSEIYALQENSHTLTHDVEHDKGASTTIDDII